MTEKALNVEEVPRHRLTTTEWQRSDATGTISHHITASTTGLQGLRWSSGARSRSEQE